MANKLSEYLVKDAILLNSQASDNRQIIRLLAAKLEECGFVKPSFCQAVIDRETNLPTGLALELPLNVAIPHTDPEHVLKAGIGFATLKSGVNFANMEDPEELLPVGFVFMLAINDKNKQIEMLKQIIGLIQERTMLARLKAANSSDEILSIISSFNI